MQHTYTTKSDEKQCYATAISMSRGEAGGIDMLSSSGSEYPESSSLDVSEFSAATIRIRIRTPAGVCLNCLYCTLMSTSRFRMSSAWRRRRDAVITTLDSRGRSARLTIFMRSTLCTRRSSTAADKREDAVIARRLGRTGGGELVPASLGRGELCDSAGESGGELDR